jgi:glycosyltransferase involved in cell wall biosynthesis
MKYIAHYNSPYVSGGVEQVVRNLVDRFSADFRKDLRLICNDPSRGAEFEYAGVKCVNLVTPRRTLPDKLFFLSRYLYSFKIYRFLKAQAKEGDVVNIHGIEYALFPGLFRRRLPASLKLVVTAHGSNFDEIDQYIVRRLPGKFWPVKVFFFFFRWVHFILEKLTCRRIDRFTFINRHIQSFYATRYGVDPARSLVIYNGFHPRQQHSREAKTNSAFTALIVGSTVYRKGLDHAIGIVGELRRQGCDVRLCVVGFSDFPGYCKGRHWDFVDYVGPVPPDQVGRYYDEADFLLFPSRFEGFPLTVLEALQHRMPVVVSRACAFDEIPGHEGLGVVVENYDAGCWAEAIRKNIVALDRYNAFLANLNTLDLGRFSWTEIASDYERMLKS